MSEKEKFVFGTENYRLILGGFLVTLIGFFLMIGGGSEDPTVFKEDELFSFRRITLAPVLVIAGYGVIIYGIMKRRKEK
ncbi:DUF3098 domain-containing protein [Crocinitomix algicola]|uniref:DUF3098 domain-containing protein n=1 Tax=Crocinitomix algicola TaxID=1740263 RepID=UPI00082FA861|nr:DUF3098 domain-containing protein [Crocinitomix algicola]